MLFNQTWARMSTGEAIHGLHGMCSTERETLPCRHVWSSESARLVEKRGTLLVDDSRHNFWNFSVDSLLRVDATFFVSSSLWLLS